MITKAVAGFYYVYVDAGSPVYPCRARGLFRKKGENPLVGDRVVFQVDRNDEGVVLEILPRKNSLKRPPLANVDCQIVMISAAQPEPNLYIADKMIAFAEDRDIEPIVVINKADLADCTCWAQIYQQAGFDVHVISCRTGQGIDGLKKSLGGRLCVFSGNTGVGKSSTINLIAPQLQLATGEISEKLGRGKHTTRHVELFHIEGGGIIADTPGFSSYDGEGSDSISKENLPFAFREFLPYLGQCKFTTCSHTGEKGCAIGQAVEEGRIARSRYEHYVMMMKQAQEIKEWTL